MNEILKNLKERRLELGLSQSELGRKLGLPQSHVSKIEQGLTDPRLSTVTDMARLLGAEPVLVPREMLSLVNALINEEGGQEPMWTLDEEGDDD